MQVKEIMTEEPICCSPDTPVPEVAKAMCEGNFGALPVVQDVAARKPVLGIITDRDIVCRTLGAGKDPVSTHVQDCMSEPIVAVNANADVDDVRREMEENQIRRVVVMDDSGACIGLVTQAKLARSLSSSQTGDMLKKVSQPSSQPSRVSAHH